MKIETVFLCDHALIDKAGKVSLIGIFDNANFTSVQNILSKFFLFAILKTDNKDQNIKIVFDIKDPEGKSILPKQPSIEIKSIPTTDKGRLIIEFNNIKFDKSGKYIFEIIANDIVLKNTPFNVTNS